MGGGATVVTSPPPRSSPDADEGVGPSPAPNVVAVGAGEGSSTFGLATEGSETFQNGPNLVIFTTMGGGEKMAKSPPPGEAPDADEGVVPKPTPKWVAVGVG